MTWCSINIKINMNKTKSQGMLAGIIKFKRFLCCMVIVWFTVLIPTTLAQSLNSQGMSNVVGLILIRSNNETSILIYSEPLHSSLCYIYLITEKCLDVDLKCMIQSSGSGSVPCEDFSKEEPKLNTNNCVGVFRVIANVTNLFNETVEIAYIIDGGDKVSETIKGTEFFEIPKKGTIDLCNDTEILLYSIYINPVLQNNGPICKDIKRNITLTLPIESPSITPTVTPSDPPSIDTTHKPSNSPTKEVERNEFNQIGSIINSPNKDDGCGYSFDISYDGRNIIMGCPLSTVNNKTSAGTVHLYRLFTDEEMSSDYEWQKLNISINGEDENYYSGVSVSFAPYTNGNIFAVAEANGGQGRVRVFQLNGTSSNPSYEQIGNDIVVGNKSLIDIEDIAVDLSGNGNRIIVGTASGSTGGNVKVFDLNGTNWEEIRSFDTLLSADILRTTVSISNDGTQISHTLATGTQGDVVYTALNATNVLNSTLNGTSFHGSISGDGNIIALGQVNNDEGIVNFFNTSNGTRLEPMGNFTTKEYDGCGSSIDLSDKGTVAVIGCEKGKITIVVFYDGPDWKIADDIKPFRDENSDSRTLTRSFRSIGDGAIDSVAINGLGTTVGSGISGFGVDVRGSPDQASPAPTSISAPSFSPDLSPSSSPSPTISSAPSLYNVGKGKGGKGSKKNSHSPNISGKGKGSKKPNAPSVFGKGKGKGKGTKSPKAPTVYGKGKGKKKTCRISKGKGTQEDTQCVARNQCNVPSDANGEDLEIQVDAPLDENVTASTLNELFCNGNNVANATATASRKLNSEQENLQILSFYASSVLKAPEGELNTLLLN